MSTASQYRLYDHEWIIACVEHGLRVRMLAASGTGANECRVLLLLSRGKEMKKTWNKPKVVEIAVGMEINSYACAELKK